LLGRGLHVQYAYGKNTVRTELGDGEVKMKIKRKRKKDENLLTN